LGPRICCAWSVPEGCPSYKGKKKLNDFLFNLDIVTAKKQLKFQNVKLYRDILVAIFVVERESSFD